MLKERSLAGVATPGGPQRYGPLHRTGTLHTPITTLRVRGGKTEAASRTDSGSHCSTAQEVPASGTSVWQHFQGGICQGPHSGAEGGEPLLAAGDHV